MSFLRHVGKHGDRKVAIIFREVPGEPHMCLVTYTELLNKHIHDPMIKCIESDIGQNSTNLADALGITDDRLYEIIEIGLNALKTESDFALALEKAIAQINHMNEATYLILVMGRAHHRSEIVNTLKDAL